LIRVGRTSRRIKNLAQLPLSRRVVSRRLQLPECMLELDAGAR
jgi:hypothetical protein